MTVRPSTIIIAEAGVNHNGSIELAYKLVDAAVKAKADIIKFQSFDADTLATENAGMATYQSTNIGKEMSQLEMLKGLEMPIEQMVELKNYCDSKNIEFLSTAFDLNSLNVLLEMGCKRIKVASGELTNKPFLDACSCSGLPVILSTGMATIEEVDWAVKSLVNKKMDINLLTILHCTTNYPAAPEELNLTAIKTIAETFQTAVGYSDHSLSIDTAIAAVSLGATVLEKHITLDTTMQGPDHAASMNPRDFEEMVSRIRVLETSLGSGVKEPQAVELSFRNLVRKSIVAACFIEKGNVFNQNNITTKRPDNGISAMYFDELIGKKANRDYQRNELIDMSCVK